LAALVRSSLRAVFNLTGTVLHTNLGRTSLPPEALQRIADAAGACILEYDLDTAGRGHGDTHLESLSSATSETARCAWTSARLRTRPPFSRSARPLARLRTGADGGAAALRHHHAGKQGKSGQRPRQEAKRCRGILAGFGERGPARP